MWGCRRPAVVSISRKKAVRANGGRQLRPQYLDRDTAPMLDVFGQVDGRHATLTELTLDAVAAVQGGI